MNGKSHAILGAAASALALAIQEVDIIDEPLVYVPALIMGVLGGLFPDIDSANNTFRKSLRLSSSQTRRDLQRTPISRPVALFYNVARFIIARILNLLDRFLPHRGPTHFLISAVFVTWLVYWFCTAWGLHHAIWITFGAGYISHLVGDGVTIRGVRAFGPIYQPAIHLMPRRLRVRVGTQSESVMLVLLVGIIFWFYLSYVGLVSFNI